jgi:hypothetical protein
VSWSVGRVFSNPLTTGNDTSSRKDPQVKEGTTTAGERASRLSSACCPGNHVITSTELEPAASRVPQHGIQEPAGDDEASDRGHNANPIPWSFRRSRSS